MGNYNELLGDIDYRNHHFNTWTEKVDWEVNAIQQAINNILAELSKGK